MKKWLLYLVRKLWALYNQSSDICISKDNNLKRSLITIGESIHASIPKTGKEMAKLAELGPEAYSAPSEPLDHIKSLIESQAA